MYERDQREETPINDGCIKDEVAIEDKNINNNECCPVKIKPNKNEKGSVEAIIVKVKSSSMLKR